VDPVYVTQTTIAVTILHKIHYSIEVPKKNQPIIGFQNIIEFFIITVSIAAAAYWGFDQYFDCFEDLQAIIIWERCATGSDVTGSHVNGSDVTGSDVSLVTESDVITVSDVIFPALFSSYYSNSFCCNLVPFS
jgi:hypothetical protein